MQSHKVYGVGKAWKNTVKLAATWESWSTHLPPSATSLELFSHFPPLIQLLVTARVHCVPLQTHFWSDVPKVWGEKPRMSLSRWDMEVEGGECRGAMIFFPIPCFPYRSLIFPSSISVSITFRSNLWASRLTAPIPTRLHPVTVKSWLIDKSLIRRDMFSLLKSTYYQLFRHTSLSPPLTWQVKAEPEWLCAPARKQTQKHSHTIYAGISAREETHSDNTFFNPHMDRCNRKKTRCAFL